MTQKLNNHQLQQSGSKTSADVNSNNKRKKQSSKESAFAHNKAIGFDRFDTSDINRYENLFDSYVYQTPQSAKPHPSKQQKLEAFEKIARSIGDDGHMSQLEKDLLEKDLREQQQIQSTAHEYQPSNIADVALKPPVVVDKVLPPIVDDVDDDLLYLESLLTNGRAEQTKDLGDLFAEIIDNEKEPISNYEPSVFNANIQMLFDEATSISKPDPADGLNAPDPTPLVAPAFSIPEEVVEKAPPVAPPLPNLTQSAIDVSKTPEISLPPVPTITLPEAPVPTDSPPAQNVSPPEPPVLPETSATDSALLAPAVEMTQEDVMDILNTDIDVREKKLKKFKIGIVDTLLIIVIIAILIVLAILYGDRLLSGLPFL